MQALRTGSVEWKTGRRERVVVSILWYRALQHDSRRIYGRCMRGMRAREVYSGDWVEERERLRAMPGGFFTIDSRRGFLPPMQPRILSSTARQQQLLMVRLWHGVKRNQQDRGVYQVQKGTHSERCRQRKVQSVPSGVARASQ